MDTDLKIDVLWEDSTSLVVAKPAGLLTTGARNIETMETRLRSLLTDPCSKTQNAYVGLPHRIDRPVSGTLLVAKNGRATKHFCAQFRTRKIGKRYLGLLSGRVQPDSGTWVDWMRKIPDVAKAEILPQQALGAKQAILHYRVIWQDRQTSLLDIQLSTGRTHQIRLQAASRKHPILGDRLYDAPAPFGPAVSDARKSMIALHARSITFRHPKTATEISVVAPLPLAWQNHEPNSQLATYLESLCSE